MIAYPDLEDDARAQELAASSARCSWPELRDWILPAGIARGDYSADLIPGGLYRVAGIAPDELPLHLERFGAHWLAMTGEECLVALGIEYRAYREAETAREMLTRRKVSDVRAQVRRDGLRRFSEHLARLEAKHGAKLDLSGIDWQYSDFYESGARTEMAGARGTIGCTSGQRPTFVFLVAFPLEPKL